MIPLPARGRPRETSVGAVDFAEKLFDGAYVGVQFVPIGKLRVRDGAKGFLNWGSVNTERAVAGLQNGKGAATRDTRGPSRGDRRFGEFGASGGEGGNIGEREFRRSTPRAGNRTSLLEDGVVNVPEVRSVREERVGGVQDGRGVGVEPVASVRRGGVG